MKTVSKPKGMIFIVLLVVFVLSSISSAAGDMDTEKEGVLRIGLEANSSPFNWTQVNSDNGGVPIANSEGEYANGYDVWMATLLTKKLGLELEVLKIEWDGLVPALQSGKIDAIIAGMSPTAERKEQIDFTDPYYRSDLVVVLNKGSDFEQAESINDFSGAKLTAQLNTFIYDALGQMEGIDKQTAMADWPTITTALLAGKLDGFVTEKPIAMAIVSANPELVYLQFEEAKGFVTSSEYTTVAIGLRKGSGLTEPINLAMEEISEADREDAMQTMIDLQTGKEQKGFFETMLDIAREYGPLFLRGAGVTMFVAVVSTIIGLIIGLIVQVIRTIPTGKNDNPIRNLFLKLVKIILTSYVEIFRGTPMMVQAMLIYYGSKLLFNWDMSSMVAALLIVSINTGAYLAEVVRGGINSVDQGQTEACRAIGLTHNQSMRYVILPQTIKAILPAIGNEFVANIKDTSVLNVISVTELFFITKSVAGTTLQIFHTYLLTAIIYFVLTFITTRIINWVGVKAGVEEY